MEGTMPDALTENGARTHSSSGNANVNFFSLAAAKRGDPEKARTLFAEAFFEDPRLAMKNLFYLRDIRGGQGERNIFRLCLRCLFSVLEERKRVEDIRKVLSLIPEYGRWDDVFSLFSFDKKSCADMEILSLISETLKKDMNLYRQKKGISLLAKWFPLEENTNNEEKKRLAKCFRKVLFRSPKECRKSISILRRWIDVCEQKMSSGDWNEIDYSKVPGKAMLRYRNAFERNDPVRFGSFLNRVEAGTEKINTGTIYPYEIVYRVRKSLEDQTNLYYDSSPKRIRIEKDKSLIELWKNLPDETNGNSAICVVDVSGSMMQSSVKGVYPIDVAVSLGIYFAERTKSVFKGKYITFSERPEVMSLREDGDVFDHVYNMIKSPWEMNTNISGVFEKILRQAKACNLDPKDMPKSVYIISDMEFDNCGTRTNFEKIDSLYSKTPYRRPNLVFWNVCSRNRNVPVRCDENGTVLVSGMSPVIFKQVVEGKTPEEFMLDVLNSPRYDAVDFYPKK